MKPGSELLKLLIVVAIVLFLGAKLLPALGSSLGSHSRKPFRQAKWMWSWLAGTEAEALEAERDYGRECARQFAAQFPGRASRASQEAVAMVGSRLAAAAKNPLREFRFSVVAAGNANAYALPGGFVFITEPLINLCEHDPDEIAFLLGHEMAHVLGGHARNQLTASAILNAVTARLTGVGLMLQQVLAKGYSRKLELEADREGARLSAAAGFDSSAAARALRRLETIAAEDAGLAEYFSSHPPLAERVRALESQAAAG
jgi:predicted Zn-dependent protease